MVSRLPIRLRVTLAFAAAMAVVLVAVGAFLYSQLGAQLDESVDESLRARATEVAALVEAAGGALGRSGGSRLIEQEESFAQVLSSDGRVLDSTPQLRGEAVLTQAERKEALAEPSFFERDSLPGLDPPVRLLAAPADAGGREVVTVVGSSLEDRDEALSSLAALLLIGGPAALVLASVVGYGVASAALRPVEAMRRRAATISASEPGERLPVSAAGDELTRLGETLNEMLTRLETALERERRFVDDASHELRTPLALQRAELELALRHAGGEAELREAIASSIEESDRVIQLAEDLLVIARSEKGELAVSREPQPVAALFATVRERFRARAEQSGRDLVIEGSDDLEVEGDRLRLEQALTNMLDNAFRHGGGAVRLWGRDDEGRVELHVSDSGSGFPPEFLPHAFERFSRADAARPRGGTGLGLAIVETIALAHGGRARARNDPRSGGADVWIEIPSGG
jgi:two-component system, OmpR family, sensor kinase